ncbi:MULTISPECIES: hypothetical protein [unclassified Aeromicrobium]|uniref:hypothetical protein n=1 Tax=unclassified Aeromicrobium TaxID=2633570 RepID=UPI00396B1351
MTITVVCIFRVRVVLAKCLYALSLAPVGVVLWAWIQYLNGTATDFFGLYFIYSGLPLIFLSVVGLLSALAAPEPFDAWG